MATSMIALLFPLITALGLTGLPLGMPPLPEDPLLARIAPEQCLWYLSSAGVATPQADSQNATERLLAEPEVQGLYDTLEKQILAMMRREAPADDPDGKQIAGAASVIRSVLTRPLAIYISKVELAGDGSGSGPIITGGLIVSLGENAAEIEQFLKQIDQLAAQGQEIKTEEAGGVTWRKLPLPSQELAWGLKGKYLIVGTGVKEAAALIGRAGQEPPAWLAKIRSRLPVERVAVVSYLNIAGQLDLAGPALIIPQVSAAVQATGIDKIKSLVSVSGLDGKECVTRTLLELRGQPAGLVALATGEPLTAADLAHIPADASLAFAMRLDSSKVFDWVMDLAGQLEPRAREEIAQGLAQLGSMIDVDLEKDFLASLDDVWSLHASPVDGGFPWTGAVLSVSVKDHAALSQVQQKFVGELRRNMPDPPENGRRNYATIRTVQVGEETIYYLNIVERDVPVAPAWCLTKERLIVGLYPQAVRGQLAVDSQVKKLADVPAVAAQLTGSLAPTGLAYIDTKAIFRTAYPAAQIAMQLAAADWQWHGLNLDVSLLPPARTIERHLQPSVMSYAKVSDGIECTTHQSLPGASITGMAPVLAALMVPAVTTSREAAQRNQDINTLKNLVLAIHFYHDVYNRLPPPQWGKDGNAGLSWRVAILPYIEENALYEQFHHDEPWDSPHNLTLIDKMPALYASRSKPQQFGAREKARPASAKATIGRAVPATEALPPTVPLNAKEEVKKVPVVEEKEEKPAAKKEAVKEAPAEKVDESKYAAYRTRFMTIRHESSAFAPGFEKGLGLKAMTDGTSKTIAIVQAAPEKAVIWTKPDDLDFNPEEPFAGLCEPGGQFLAAFCDGHVEVIVEAVGKAVMQAIVTRNGGEAVRTNDY